MVCSWLCMLDINGIPIFDRNYGIPQSHEFQSSNAGLLFVIRQACQHGNFEMKQMATKDSQIVIKEFECGRSGMTIILVTSDMSISIKALHAKLSLIWDAMVMILGEKTLGLRAHIIRSSIRLVSGLIDLLMEPSTGIQTAIGCPEILLPGSSKLINHVHELSQHLGTGACALYYNKRLAVGTEMWHEMHAVDLLLLATFLETNPSIKYRDMIIYLPHTSLGEGTVPGRQPYRLLTVRLMGELEVVCLSAHAQLPESLVAIKNCCHHSIINDFQRALPDLDR